MTLLRIAFDTFQTTPGHASSRQNQPPSKKLQTHDAAGDFFYPLNHTKIMTTRWRCNVNALLTRINFGKDVRRPWNVTNTSNSSPLRSLAAGTWRHFAVGIFGLIGRFLQSQTSEMSTCFMKPKSSVEICNKFARIHA